MKNWKTTLGTVMTAVGLIPQGIATMGLTDLPPYVKVTGMVCSFVFFIYTGVNAKDRDVTGTGENATRE